MSTIIEHGFRFRVHHLRMVGIVITLSLLFLLLLLVIVFVG